MSFDKIIREDLLELKSARVTIKGTDGEDYKFTVNEITPYEMGYCLDEFQKVDFVALTARAVRDKDGKRMSIEQARRLPSDVLAIFVKAYDDFFDKDHSGAEEKKS
jgi:hypothetical protein